MKFRLVNGTLIAASEDAQALLDKFISGSVLELEEADSPSKSITGQQRKALRKWERLVAQEMIYEGITMDKVLESKPLKVDPTMELLHESVIKPICLAMFDKTSTEKLEPKEVNEIYVVADRFFKTNFNISIPFPQWEDLAK